MRRVCVYAGSNTGSRPEYAEAAAALARELAARGVGLVFGGGKVGLMGVLADTILAHGGEAIGVLDAAGFYASLLGLLDHMVGEGFLRAAHRGAMLADADPAGLLDRMAGWTPPAVHKWIDIERS